MSGPAAEGPVTAGRASPLAALHRRLGAKLTAFGGWEMPLSYPSGTVAEHLACRRDAAIFDVSHLGTVRLTGDAAFDVLQENLTNDLRKIAPGRAQYTHLLDPGDGSVTDDCIVWWVAPERFDLMPNASNTARVRAAVGGSDVTGERAVLALQGPAARERLSRVVADAASVGRFRVGTVEWDGTTLVVAGTGYTGEDGVEIAVPVSAAEALWEAFVAAGFTPAGLGARDTLRLEAGLPLHGQDLGPGITPLQAGLGWVVGWGKGPFRGREPLEAERARGPARLLRGVRSATRRPLRAGDLVERDGRTLGALTSGGYSPVLEVGIGLALLEGHVEDGEAVSVSTRGGAVAASVVTPPFVPLGRSQ